MYRGMRFTGAVFLFAGTFLYGMIRLAVALYMPHMNGWDSKLGKAWSARIEIGATAPYYLSILLMVVGVILLLVLLYHDLKKLLRKTD